MNNFISKMLSVKLACVSFLIIANFYPVYGFNFSLPSNYNNSYFILGTSIIILIVTAISLGFCYSICLFWMNKNRPTSKTYSKDFKIESQKLTKVTTSTSCYSPELIVPSSKKSCDEFDSEPALSAYWQTIEIDGNLRSPHTKYPANRLTISKV